MAGVSLVARRSLVSLPRRTDLYGLDCERGVQLSMMYQARLNTKNQQA